MGRVIEFEIAGERYTMFVTGILKRKYYLMRESDRSILADPIPVKVSASTLVERFLHWLDCLHSYMRKREDRRTVKPVAAVLEIVPDGMSNSFVHPPGNVAFSMAISMITMFPHFINTISFNFS